MEQRFTFATTPGLDGNTLSGIAYRFGQRTLVDGRWVQFARSAFDAVLADPKTDVRALFQHDPAMLLGRQSNGTVEVTTANDGLHYSIKLPDTSYAADIKALIARGDLTEMSFGIVPGQVRRSTAEDGKRLDLHLSVQELFDVSPVSMPAFGGTSVQMHNRRSRPMTDETLKPTATVPEIMAVLDGITAKANAEGRSMTDDETFAFEAAETQLAARQKTDEMYKRQQARNAFVTDGLPAIIKPQARGDAAEYEAFNNYLRTGVANSDMTFAQNEGTPSAGGYAVPTEFTDKLIERRAAYGGLMNAAQNITTATGRPIDWAVTVDNTTSTAADIAAEGAASAAGADLAFDTVTLGAYKYAATGTGNVALKVSVELLQDASFDIGAFVAKALGDRIRRKQAYDLIMGSGSGAPQGIAYGTGGTLEADLSAYTSLNNLVHSLDPEYRQGAEWIMNDTTMKAVEALVDTNARPILVNSLNGVDGSIARPTILGYPVIIDQAMPTWAADDVIGIAFGRWSEAYIVRHVKDVQVLVNPYLAVGYVAYDAWARMDGKVQNAYAYVTGEGV